MACNCTLVPDSLGGASLSFGQDVVHLTRQHVERSSVLQHLMASCAASTEKQDSSCHVAGLQQQHCEAWIEYLGILNSAKTVSDSVYPRHESCSEAAAPQSSRAVAEALMVRNSFFSVLNLTTEVVDLRRVQPIGCSCSPHVGMIERVLPLP